MPIVYRVIKYEGSNEWLDELLYMSLKDGVKEIRKDQTITVASVDPLDMPTIEFCRDQIRRMTARVAEETKDRRAQIHDASHGTYYPGPCLECKEAGWLDDKGRLTG